MLKSMVDCCDSIERGDAIMNAIWCSFSTTRCGLWVVFPHVTFHGISIPHVRSQGRVMEMVEWNGNGQSLQEGYT